MPKFISDLERGVSGISIETLKVICEKLRIASDSILFPERLHNNVDDLTDKIKNMTSPQFKAIEQIINAFLSALNAEK